MFYKSQQDTNCFRFSTKIKNMRWLLETDLKKEAER